MGVYLYIYNIVIIVVNDHRSIIMRYIGRPIPGEKNSCEETYILLYTIILIHEKKIKTILRN